MPHQFETLAVHGGHTPTAEQPSRAIPVHRTTAYRFENTEHAANLFALKELGYIYTRIMNPTQDALEQRMAALEGGAAALAVASGTAAIHYSIINIAEAGDEIVSSSHLYGGTFTMFNDILPNYGITTRFVEPTDLDGMRAAINERTRAVFVETIGNPALSVPDLEAIAKIAHDAHLPLIVDATFTTPYLLRAIDYGADIVCTSLTKWIGGHGTGIGGIVVDSGKFDWTKGPFRTLNEPEASYHGVRFAHDLGDLNAIGYLLRMRVVPLRNLGSAISPDNAWMFLQGLETLALRMERHSENAGAVAEFLTQHKQVEWVSYPGLPDHPTHQNARKYLTRGYGGMVVFGIKGGKEAGQRFINKLGLFSHVANVGDAKSLAIHPGSTTHSQLDDDAQRSAGLQPELVRLSIGIENITDIIADLENALG